MLTLLIFNALWHLLWHLLPGVQASCGSGYAAMRLLVRCGRGRMSRILIPRSTGAVGFLLMRRDRQDASADTADHPPSRRPPSTNTHPRPRGLVTRPPCLPVAAMAKERPRERPRALSSAKADQHATAHEDILMPSINPRMLTVPSPRARSRI